MNALSPKALWLTGLMLLPATLAAEENPRAFMLASSCAACHGTDGNSPGVIPPLQGKSAKFIETAL